jgi:hypothetical protein
MSDKEFMDVKVLVKKMIEGEIQINKPMVITTMDRTSTEELSFLSHLLKYNGVDKNTIFVFLNEVLEVFNKRLEGMMSNDTIKKFIDKLKEEWKDMSDILFRQSFDQEEIKLIEDLIENINGLCKKFKGITDKVESNNITDVLDEDEMIENMDMFLKNIEEVYENIGEIREKLTKYETELNKLNMCVLLDLSMKNKELYLITSDIDSDKKISNNIHNIFLNYLFILNLIKKHLIYYNKTVDKVEQISTNMKKHTTNSKTSVKRYDSLFMKQEQEKGIEEYLSKLSL